MYITAAKMPFFPSGPGQPHTNVRGYSIIFGAQLGRMVNGFTTTNAISVYHH
jgi:hypothetical protein